jgi:hypothetical protein
MEIIVNNFGEKGLPCSGFYAQNNGQTGMAGPSWNAEGSGSVLSEA